MTSTKIQPSRSFRLGQAMALLKAAASHAQALEIDSFGHKVAVLGLAVGALDRAHALVEEEAFTTPANEHVDAAASAVAVVLGTLSMANGEGEVALVLELALDVLRDILEEDWTTDEKSVDAESEAA